MCSRCSTHRGAWLAQALPVSPSPHLCFLSPLTVSATSREERRGRALPPGGRCTRFLLPGLHRPPPTPTFSMVRSLPVHPSSPAVTWSPPSPPPAGRTQQRDPFPAPSVSVPLSQVHVTGWRAQLALVKESRESVSTGVDSPTYCSGLPAGICVFSSPFLWEQ